MKFHSRNEERTVDKKNSQLSAHQDLLIHKFPLLRTNGIFPNHIYLETLQIKTPTMSRNSRS